MQSTGSISRGKTAQKHNTRECYRDREHTPDNIDFDRRGDNIVLVDRRIEDVYRDRFGAAAEAYNAKQVEKGHPERQIPDYLEHVRRDKKLNEMYEFVVQLGNVDEHPDHEVAAAIYREWLDGFSHRYGAQFCIKQAIVHMDEAVAHMHVEVVPVAESKRGLAVQNSMNKAVRQAGHADYKDMLAGWDEVLTECMEKHGIERVAGDRELQMGGVDIDTYKRTMAVVNEAERRSMELNTEIADKQGDLVELDSAIEDREAALKDASERLECLQQRIAEREMEPAQETVSESVRKLCKARGDGAREGRLAGEIEGLRSRIGELEGERGELVARGARLDARVEYLRGGLARARERFEGLAARVDDYVANVGQRVAALLQSLGVRAYAGNPPLSELVGMERAAARAYNAERAARGEVQHPSRDRRPSI